MIFNFLKTSYAAVKRVLSQTGSLIGSKLRSLFSGPIDEEALEKLEQILYEADLGVHYALELTNHVRNRLKKNPSLDSSALIEGLKQEILVNLLTPSKHAKTVSATESIPYVILVVGVNGNGKTTSVAKLANLYQKQGKKIIVGAADTFRAAAIEQLETWTKRIEVDLVKGNHKGDPAAVAFDTVSAGKARGADIVLIDTAGRLQTKTPLMQELEKIRRSCSKVNPNAPHETLLVLDATAGQNAVDQVKTFHEFTPITGLILTKLDGSAKGGIVLSIHRQLGIPIQYVGIGEGIEDLEIFDPNAFVNALFE